MPRPVRRAVVAAALAAALAVPVCAPLAHAAPPGAAAAAVAAVDTGLLGDVTFSVPPGTFRGEVSVALGTSVAGAQVRYTTDGSAPTASSPVYSAPLRLTRSTEVRAQAFVGGTATGAPAAAQYVATAVTDAHDLPVLLVDSFGRGAVGDDYHPAAVMEFQPGDGTTSLTAAPTLVGRTGYRLRGQSSRMFDKKPYRLELWDAEGDDLDLPFFGMPAESDWVLRGPFADKSLIREALVLDIGRELGLAVPRYRLVEVYVNDDAAPVAADDYRGVYLLLETVKNQKNRLDLKKLDADDVAPPAVEGGYVLKFEWMATEGTTLRCTGAAATCWRDLEVHDPDDLVPQQQAWITQYVQRVHDVLHSPGRADPTTGYPSLIEVDSFVDLVVVNELSRNMDAYYRSVYLYKDRGGKLTAGPLWDYDLTFGVGGYFGNDQVAGWQYQQTRQTVATDWFSVLMADPAFANRVRARWQELRRGPLSDAALRTRVAELSAEVENAAARNVRRYPNLTTRMVGPFITSTTGTWRGQVQEVQDWALRRAAWLDGTQAWGAPATPVPTPTPSPTATATPRPTATATVTPRPTPTATPRPTTTATPTAAPAGCTATFRAASRWPGGLQGEVTVTAGSSALAGWTVGLALPAGASLQQSWNATVSGTGGALQARDAGWNGALRPGASTTFGFLLSTASGDGTPTLTCTAR
ncbi:CotH kinase family protein [Cellulomonas telluris]|uniref:CotH kinase family protein n=1 Tax=Cellulomonas telluris TaxID=2306636 RepID=UPI0010A8C322|nr:CotH kinase family protein [Cellulomonas telluris]